jgi:hypothetical protein
MILQLGEPINPEYHKGGNIMKLYRLFRTHLIIVLLGCMVIGFGLPRDANAVICNFKGYVVQMIQNTGPTATVWFREKPIDAGQYIGGIGNTTAQGLGMVNTLRSAYQNSTQVGIQTNYPAVSCPTPDLSMPGWASFGTIIGIWPSSLLP